MNLIVDYYLEPVLSWNIFFRSIDAEYAIDKRAEQERGRISYIPKHRIETVYGSDERSFGVLEDTLTNTGVLEQRA